MKEGYKNKTESTGLYLLLNEQITIQGSNSNSTEKSSYFTHSKKTVQRHHQWNYPLFKMDVQTNSIIMELSSRR